MGEGQKEHGKEGVRMLHDSPTVLLWGDCDGNHCRFVYGQHL